AWPRSAPPARPATTSRSTPSRRESTVTVAPRPASSSAAARPMPSEAPHTSAWRPERFRSMRVLPYQAVSGAAAELAHHLRPQRVVAFALRRRKLAEAEAARQRVVLVQPVEADELGVQQRGAGAVLAVVGQGVAVAVEDLGGAALADPQACPHHGPPQGGQPPFGPAAAGGGVAGGAHASAHSSDTAVASSAPRVTIRETRAGVARPVNARSGNSRY